MVSADHAILLGLAWLGLCAFGLLLWWASR